MSSIENISNSPATEVTEHKNPSISCLLHTYTPSSTYAPPYLSSVSDTPSGVPSIPGLPSSTCQSQAPQPPLPLKFPSLTCLPSSLEKSTFGFMSPGKCSMSSSLLSQLLKRVTHTRAHFMCHAFVLLPCHLACALVMATGILLTTTSNGHFPAFVLFYISGAFGSVDCVHLCSPKSVSFLPFSST